MSLVLVTGATGFTAQHIVDQLLEKKYKVVGTARSQAKADTLLANFSKIHDISNLSLEIVPDIGSSGAFDDILKKYKFDYVIHTASPISLSPVDDLYGFYVKPAVAGCLSILEGVKKFAPSVKNVVVTSSIGTALNFDQADNMDFVHTEDTWNPLDWSDVKSTFQAYAYSKTAAELASRKFVEVNQSELNYTYTSVNPTFIFGPHVFASNLEFASGSSEIFNSIISYPPDKEGPFNDIVSLACDVRDVARLHIEPLSDPEKFHNSRLCVSSGEFSPQTILDVLNSRFPELKGKFPKGNSAEGEKYLQTHGFAADFSKTLKLAGSLTPLEETIYDSAKQFFDFKEKLSKSEK
ncbi:unnamed protein product [Kuraishia capsulata CBS 1993]|uniref:NAD-dependent epimerase/dehydratase domain-containing protein n=1 Tax=Kuraishia capsulata CBS 1993 TaxID=1382522 RepID=W6MT34_9ASCO|nr:uncharacterized protein KUCA_T00000897001 [Kuraishia capsulata CBS 1993]CDK24930.1 unnamed protein product [Kuraishia capsulata CBS 1993]